MLTSLTLFRSSSSNVHKLIKEMNQLLLGLLNKFVLPQSIHAATKITEIDLCLENQKDDDDLLLGSVLRSYLLELDDDVAGTSELVQFYVRVRDFLSTLVQSAIKRLPFEDTVLNDLEWLDLNERMTSNVSMVRRLAQRFPNFVPTEKRDQLEEEFCLYQTTRDLQEDILYQQDIDIYWGRIGKLELMMSKPFGVLANFAKCLLSIPHGNSDSERMFSHINLIVTDHRNQLQTSTVSACLDVKINSKTTDCRHYEPTADAATRKVTPGSELAPNSPHSMPILPATVAQQTHRSTRQRH